MAAREWWGADIVPRIQWQIEIGEGYEIPDGYGIAWPRWDRHAAVCMPLPLNVLAGLVRGVYLWLRRGFFVSGFDPRFYEAIRYGERRGRESAWDEGYDEAMHMREHGLLTVRRNPHRMVR
jgi:hypothetical protein